MPTYVGCCCPGGSGSGSGGYNPGCYCVMPATVTIEVSNLSTECSFDSSCPYSGLQNAVTYTLGRCNQDTSGPGEAPAYCLSQYKLGTLSVCDIVALYTADPCDVCLLEDPSDPLHDCQVAIYKFIGTVDCGGGTGPVDIYMGIFVQLYEEVNGAGAGVNLLTVTVDIYHVQVFTDFTPAVVVRRGTGYQTGGVDLTSVCFNGEPGGNCFLTGATGGNAGTASFASEDPCPTAFTFENNISGGTCCNEDGINPVELVLSL